jgi:hypothetical protein
MTGNTLNISELQNDNVLTINNLENDNNIIEINHKGQGHIITINQRRKDVLELMVKGVPKHELVESINSKYGVCLSTIENDMTVVRKEFHEYYLDQKKHIIDDHLKRYEELYRKNVDIAEKDYQKVAMLALKGKENLLKIHDAPIQINNNQQNNIQANINLDNLSPDDLKNLLKNLHE